MLHKEKVKRKHAEKHTKKAVLKITHSPKQSSCQICTLVGVVITIIQLSPAQNGGQQTVDHIAEEVSCMHGAEKETA